MNGDLVIKMEVSLSDVPPPGNRSERSIATGFATGLLLQCYCNVTAMLLDGGESGAGR
jgi:hypothetical protein